MASAAGRRSGNRVGRVKRERSGAMANVIKMWNMEIEDGRETDGEQRERKRQREAVYLFIL